MKTIKDEVVMETHERYDDWERTSLIIDLDKRDYIVIQVFSSNEELLETREFVAKYDNSHINCQWQDKGARKLNINNKRGEITR